MIYLHGIIFAEHHVLVAVGLDPEGGKHVLGLAEGPSENAVVARGLLEDLARRGVKPDRRRLFSSAILKGLFSERSHFHGALVQ